MLALDAGLAVVLVLGVGLAVALALVSEALPPSRCTTPSSATIPQARTPRITSVAATHRSAMTRFFHHGRRGAPAADSNASHEPVRPRRCKPQEAKHAQRRDRRCARPCHSLHLLSDQLLYGVWRRLDRGPEERVHAAVPRECDR